MPNIIDILARAQSLMNETALNSITPPRAGGIMYDTLLVLNQMQLEGASLLISKVYASVSAMEADTTPTSDLTGRALKPGQLVVIVTSSASSSDMGSEYRYNGPGSWTYVGKVGGLPLDTVPTQNSTKGITSGGVYTALAAMKAEGYKYMGLATPGSGGTSPGTPNQPVFYIAGPGSYPNFGSITVASGYLGFIKYSSGSWSVESVAVGKDYDAQISALDGQISQLEAKVNGINLTTGDADVHQVNTSSDVETTSGTRLRLVYYVHQGEMLNASCTLGKGVAANIYDTLSNAVKAGTNQIQTILSGYSSSISFYITQEGYLTVSLCKNDSSTFSEQDKSDFLAATTISIKKGTSIPYEIAELQNAALLPVFSQYQAMTGFGSWPLGYIKTDGSIKLETQGSYRVSFPIFIKPDSKIIINKIYGVSGTIVAVAAYTAQNVYVAACSHTGGSVSSSSPVEIDTTGYNISYIRITYGGGYADPSVLVDSQTSTKTANERLAVLEGEINALEIGTQWNGKSWVALGTSITDTNNTLAPGDTPTGKYVPYLVAKSGLVVTNKGVAGAVIGGHILYYAGHTTETATADIITIEGGVNDWAGNRPLGEVGDTVPYLVEWSSPVWNNGGSADGTFAGACYQTIKTAMENAPKAQVIVITDNTGQYIAGTGAHCERERQNSLGLLQKDYTDMLIKVAHYMGVPVINAGQRCMINQENPEYLVDQIHHTELGGKQYCDTIWSELKDIPLREIS